MTYEEFYGAEYQRLKAAESHLTQSILEYQCFLEDRNDFPVIEFCRSRIKSPESMTAKLRKRGFPVNAEAALTKVNDALGIQIVCSFFRDIYRAASWLRNHPDFRVIQIKDYIAHPKSSGYRSYHVILEIVNGEGAESGRKFRSAPWLWISGLIWSTSFSTSGRRGRRNRRQTTCGAMRMISFLRICPSRRCAI